MPGEHRAGGQRVRVAQPLGLRVRHHGQGHLGELGQVQHAIRVLEHLAAHRDLGRVLIHDALDGKAQVGPGVTVGAAPDLARGGAGLAISRTHALGLHALARVDVGGARLRQKRLAARDHLAADAAGHLERRADAHAPDALDGDLDDVIELHHAVHVVRPAGHLAVAPGDVLGGGGEPHPVHQRRAQSDEPRGVVGGVDRVVVAAHQRERGHVVRGGDHGAVHKRARGGLHSIRVGAAAELRGGHGRGGHGRAAADGEAVHLGGHDLAAGGELEFDGDDAPGGGLLNRAAVRGHVDGAPVGKLAQRHTQVDEVVEVHGVEQALDDGEAVGQHAGTKRGVDRRPARPNEHVRGARHDVLAERGASHRGVRGEQGSGEGERGVGDAVDKRGHLGNVVAGLGGRAHARQAGEQVVDGLRQTLVGHDRGRAGGDTRGQVDRDGHVTHVEGALVLRQVVPVGVGDDADHPAVGLLDDLESIRIHRVGGVVHQVAVPDQCRGGLEVLLDTGGVGEAGEALGGGDAGVEKRVRRGGLEAAEELGDGLVLLGDSRDRDGAGDDADLVGSVAGVLGLPQRVLAKPDLQVPVDRGHPRHRLRVGVVQR